MKNIRVSLDNRSYSIFIGKDLLQNAGEHIAPVLPMPKVVVITDTNVAPLHLPALNASLARAGIIHSNIIVPAGEQSKSFSTLERVIDQLLAEKAERNLTLIALGGGVMGDLAGFAASILLRGVPFIQIPTTLLAQVDSSVGGKTGINTRHGKNLVGAFYQPKLVLADTGVLSTLPERERKAGYAEIVKYGVINDEPFFTWLEQNGQSVLSLEGDAVAEAIAISCRHKADIVAADEREGSVRALLNLGHTFAHALEAETGFSQTLLHGEAVSIGMVLALQLSAIKGLCPESDVERLISHLKATGLPWHMGQIRDSWDIPAVISHFAKDKKVSHGTLTFILARGIGQSFISKEVTAEEIHSCFEQHFSFA